MKRTALRKVSKKRAAQLAMYRGLKDFILRQRPFCECLSPTAAPSCMNRASTLHHIRGRIGPNLCDERYLMPICVTCHDWIHSHAREARRLGLLQ